MSQLSWGSDTYRDKIKTAVTEIIALQGEIEPDEITLEKHLFKQLGLDSLDFVEIIMFLEAKLQVEIDDLEAEKVNTVYELVEMLDKILRQRNG